MQRTLIVTGGNAVVTFHVGRPVDPRLPPVGVRLHVQVQDMGCGGTIHLSNDNIAENIASPSTGGDKYSNNMHCLWVVTLANNDEGVSYSE